MQVLAPVGLQSRFKFLAEIVHQAVQLGKMIHERLVVSRLIRSETKSSKKPGARILLSSILYPHISGSLIPN